MRPLFQPKASPYQYSDHIIVNIILSLQENVSTKEQFTMGLAVTLAARLHGFETHNTHVLY